MSESLKQAVEALTLNESLYRSVKRYATQIRVFSNASP